MLEHGVTEQRGGRLGRDWQQALSTGTDSVGVAVCRAPLKAPGEESRGPGALRQWRRKEDAPLYRHTEPGLGMLFD